MNEEMDKTVARIGVYLHQIEINLETIRTSTEIIEKARSEIGELCYNLKLKEVEGNIEAVGIPKEQIFEYMDKMHEKFKIREKIKIVVCSVLCSLNESWKFYDPTEDCIRRCKGKMRRERGNKK